MESGPVISQDAVRRFLRGEARHWGKAVRDRRSELKLTLDQVAVMAGTTPQTVFKVEKGQIIARDNLRIALAFALGSEPSDLFPMPTRNVIWAEVA